MIIYQWRRSKLVVREDSNLSVAFRRMFNDGHRTPYVI